MALENSVVVRRGGRNFRLRDLAEVRPAFEDPQFLVRSNTKNVVQVIAEKRSGANTVTVSRALRAALPVIQEELPFAVDYFVTADQGQDLED